jgi:hypothetical protein
MFASGRNIEARDVAKKQTESKTGERPVAIGASVAPPPVATAVAEKKPAAVVDSTQKKPIVDTTLPSMAVAGGKEYIAFMSHRQVDTGDGLGFRGAFRW